MSDNRSPDLLLTGALFAGAGVAGFLGARWFASTRTRPAAAPPGAVAPSPPMPPASPSPAALPAPLDVPGPVTSPAQVEHTATAAAPPPGLSRRFDPIFERHRDDIPIEFLRALAMRESGMNPRSQDGAAWGLLQITEPVRRDFNTTHRTQYARAQLLDPETNVRIGTWLLRLIVARYQRHSDLPNMRADWSNPRFAELVIFGWNGGWSESRGVGAVARWLKAKGARDVDIDLIHQNAREAGAVTHLSNTAKVRWCKGVVALYLRERALSPQPVATPNA